MIGILKKTDRILVILQESFLIVSVIVMVLLIVWQVLARYVLYISVPYAEELARLSIVWCIFIGGALAVRLEEHVYVESLIRVIPAPFRLVCKFLTYGLMVCFCYVLIYYGARYYRIASDDYTTSLGYCRNIFYLPAVISGVLMMLYTVANMFFTAYLSIAKKDIGFDKGGE